LGAGTRIDTLNKNNKGNMENTTHTKESPSKKDSAMTESINVLLAMYESEMSWAKQAEDQRTAITNIILIVASIVVGLIPQSGGLGKQTLPVAILLTALGLYGALVSQKLYERHRFHYGRARFHRRKLNELLPAAEINKSMDAAENEHKKQYKWLYRVSFNRLWMSLYITIAIAGVILTVFILVP